MIYDTTPPNKPNKAERTAQQALALAKAIQIDAEAIENDGRAYVEAMEQDPVYQVENDLIAKASIGLKDPMYLMAASIARSLARIEYALRRGRDLPY